MTRKKLRTDKGWRGAHDLTSAPPRPFASSFLFFCFLAALCAGGYFYYDYQQQRTRQEQEARAVRAQEANRLRAENERKMKELFVAKKKAEHKKQASRYAGMQDAPPKDALSESDAELAAREAKERESILAAEELQNLKEMEDRADFLNPYRHEQMNDEDAEPQPAPAANAVVAALEQYDVFNAKPNPKADYYIYLCSAGWCPNCANEMPSIRAACKNMRRAGKVQIILVSFDKTLVEAKAYAKRCQLNSPTLWIEAMRKKVFQQLPGFVDDGCGIPHVFVVDKNGSLITRGHGSILKNWRDFTTNNNKG